MATIQLGNTKVANKLLSYAEKRAEERGGVNCPAEYARSQLTATRELWGKPDGIQAHHVIQSFKPEEVSPALANRIGQDLAKEMAPGHESVVYTHTDKDHIHNHIVINSVNYEDGSKYQSSKKDLYKIREQSDELCKERGLSIVKEPSAEKRYHRAEYGLAKRGEVSWKDEIRKSVDLTKGQAQSLDDLADKLNKEFDIETKITNKNISFKHPDKQRFVRGNKLGLAYEKETLAHEFNRKVEGERERGTATREPFNGHDERIADESNRQRAADGHSERVRGHANGQGHGNEDGHTKGIVEHQGDERKRAAGNDFDLEKARNALEHAQDNGAKGFGKWKDGDERKQQPDVEKASNHGKQSGRGNEQDQRPHENRDRENERERRKQPERSRDKDLGHDLER